MSNTFPVLFVAGHGMKPNGQLDTGAIGLKGLNVGEHRYFRDRFFPALKKYIPSNVKHIHFFSEHATVNYGDIHKQALKYGKNTVVIEMHFDAFNGKGQGGHVIVKEGFEPDALDLRLRDVIDNMIGVRYSYRGYRGISGRSNLRNVNVCASQGINYRLLELGFGDNPRDATILDEQVDEYAEQIIESVLNTSLDTLDEDTGSGEELLTGFGSVESIANQIISGRDVYGNVVPTGVANRAKYFNIPVSKYQIVQDLVNRKLGVTGSKPKKEVSRINIDSLAQQVISGVDSQGQKIPNGVSNRAKHFGMSVKDYQNIQNRVNQLLSGGQPVKVNSLNIENIARQVVNGFDSQGRRIPNGVRARAKHFGLSQADYQKVQNRVNQLL